MATQIVSLVTDGCITDALNIKDGILYFFVFNRDSTFH